jgi:hypothetical protein
MYRIMSPLDDCEEHPGRRLYNLLRFPLLTSGVLPEGLPLVPVREGSRAACRCMSPEEGDRLRAVVEEAFNSGGRRFEEFDGEIPVDPAGPEVL